MARRIDVELTSARGDGTWTWRAAGAKQPKGDLDGALLYEGAKVGDVVRADADFAVDGITVIAVQPPKADPREQRAVETIEIIGSGRGSEGGVTTQLAERGRKGRGRGDRDGGDRRDRRERGDRGDRGDRGRRDRDDRDRPGRGPRRGADRRAERDGARRDRGDRPAHERRPSPPARPKAPRLRTGRAWRSAVLATLDDAHRPLADELLRNGVPGVRQTVDRLNAALDADGKGRINPGPILGLAERLNPALRAAEWRDRAEAALAQADSADLRDLRSVVAAADAARDDESRELAESVRAAVDARVEREHRTWLDEIAETLAEGRVVRALRLSSRPPKAGTPFPTDLATRLAAAAGASLTEDTAPDRYALVLDAVATSPVRTHVEPAHVPAEPAPELVAAVRKQAGRLPQIAARFGIEPASSGRTGRSAGRPAAG